jgi:aryl-phospho-beta-D-glucosidase BglC (GH1 family)
MLGHVDDAVRRIEAHHMAVILDLHDEQRSYESAAGGQRLETFWSTFASHFASSNPRWTAFELLNEPIFTDNPAAWDGLQRRLLAEVRRVVPRHTIVATGADWGSVTGLAKLSGVGDEGTVYSVHFYDPFVFTHQGADWAPDYQPISGLQFPAKPDNCAHVLSNLGEPARQLVQDYCADSTASDLGLALRPGIDWATSRHRRLFVGEFGVYCLNAPRDGKLRWYDAIMPILKSRVDGWAVWGYDDCFGLGRHVTSGQVTVDQEVLKRLTG